MNTKIQPQENILWSPFPDPLPVEVQNILSSTLGNLCGGLTLIDHMQEQLVFALIDFEDVEK